MHFVALQIIPPTSSHSHGKLVVHPAVSHQLSSSLTDEHSGNSMKIQQKNKNFAMW